MPWSLLSGGLPPTEALTRELPGDDCIKVAAGGPGKWAQADHKWMENNGPDLLRTLYTSSYSSLTWINSVSTHNHSLRWELCRPHFIHQKTEVWGS